MRRSTKLCHNVPRETRRAQELLAAEKTKQTIVSTEPERWEFWVPQYIAERYEDSPKSRNRYEVCWRALRNFLSVHKIAFPRQLDFKTTALYVSWRRTGSQAHGVRPASKNTAILEVKFLGLLMKRAILLGYATVNPCSGLGLKKAKPKEKPPITPEDMILIWQRLQDEPEWMRTNFLICRYTGCRENEARLPLSCVDVAGKFIHFPTTKGDKPFTVPMRQELAPLFERLIRERGWQGMTFEMPKLGQLVWWKFFQRIGLGKYCFHCLRVTFATELAEAGVPLSEAKRLMNHASDVIAMTYRKLKPEGLRQYLDRAQFASLARHDAPGNPDVPVSTSCTRAVVLPASNDL